VNPMARKWVVGVLSTDYDLREYRAAIIDLLKSRGVIPSAFELADFPVEPDIHSHDACLVALDRVDVAIVIIDKRAGGVYVNSSDVTITEQEYLNFAKAHKPHLVFVSRGTWEERHFYKTQLEKSKKTKANFDKKYACTYVKSIKVLDFVEEIQRAYPTNGTSNWITQFDGIEDLKEKVIGKLSGLSRFYCEQIVKKQIQIIESRHTSTSMMMNLGDVLNRGYYVEPDYEIKSGTLSDGESLDIRIVNSLVNQKSTLVIAEAGYGKTTVLAKSYLCHANTCLRTHDYDIPFYISLKSKGGDYHFDVDKFLEECFIENLDMERYPFFTFESIRPYFYLDGFDEIAEKLTNEELHIISNSSLINHPFLLTCRNQYAHRYIQNVDFTDKISARVLLKPWSIVKAREYINNFCIIQGREDLVQNINGLLTDNTELNDILDNPLLITMLLWIIEMNGLQIPETIKSRVHLFREYIGELANRELVRLNIYDVTNDQLVKIWSLAAWEVYYANLKKETMTFPVIFEKLQENLPYIPQLYNESCFEALFVSYREHINGTFHEQFLEYLSANAIFHACNSAKYPYPGFLSQVVRPEINRYFRALWQESSAADKNNVILNIKKAYNDRLLNEDPVSICTRVHAVYHLSRFYFEDRAAFINNALTREPHISVKLSLYFGAIKSGDLDKEEELFQLLSCNPSYSDANRGYHLAYYNDMIMNDILPFKDNPALPWTGTLTAFLRHFRSSDHGHYYLRRIDLLTMKQLFEVRKSNEPVDKSALDEIETLIFTPVIQSHPEFQEKVEAAFNDMKATWDSFTC